MQTFLLARTCLIATLSLSVPAVAQNTIYAEDNKTAGERGVDKPAVAPAEWSGLPMQELVAAEVKRETEIANGANEDVYVDALDGGRVDKPAISPSDWAGLPQEELGDSQDKADDEGMRIASDDGGSIGDGPGFDKGADDMSSWPAGSGVIASTDPAEKEAEQIAIGAYSQPRISKPLVDPSEWRGLPAEELVSAAYKTEQEGAGGAWTGEDLYPADPTPPSGDSLIYGNRESIHSALAAYGLSTVNTAMDGARDVTARLEGQDFAVRFFGCENDPDRCQSIAFVARFDGAVVDAARLNNWNAERRAGRAYLDADGAAVIDWDMGIAGGVNRATFNQAVDNWAQILRSFASYVQN